MEETGIVILAVAVVFAVAAVLFVIGTSAGDDF